VTYEGRALQCQGITAHPRPPSHPHPPIWIGGNTAAARRRVAEYGDGWCPFPAQGMLAKTARTDVLDSNGQLAQGIDDLRAVWMPRARPGDGRHHFLESDRWHAGRGFLRRRAYLDGLEELAKLGVTWTQVSVPGDSVDGALAAGPVPGPGDRAVQSLSAGITWPASSSSVVSEARSWVNNTT
jgi:hypothetical protein